MKEIFLARKFAFLLEVIKKQQTKTAPNYTVQTFDWRTISKQIMQNRDFRWETVLEVHSAVQGVGFYCVGSKIGKVTGNS